MTTEQEFVTFLNNAISNTGNTLIHGKIFGIESHHDFAFGEVFIINDTTSPDTVEQKVVAFKKIDSTMHYYFVTEYNADLTR